MAVGLLHNRPLYLHVAIFMSPRMNAAVCNRDLLTPSWLFERTKMGRSGKWVFIWILLPTEVLQSLEATRRDNTTSNI